NLEIVFDEVLASPDTAHLLLGTYEKVLPALKAALEKHLHDTNPLVDQPSIRLCRFALRELDDMIAFGTQAIAGVVVAEATRRKPAAWLSLLGRCVEAAGELESPEL